MYVIMDTEHTATLMEMSRKAFDQCVADEKKSFKPTLFSSISAQRAHRWVKDGGHHSTALYVDSYGRIRRARENS